LIAGAIVGVLSGSALDSADTEAARKRRKNRKRKARGEAIPLQCPTTCNQNCSNKPLRGGSNLTRCNLSDRNLDGVQLNGSNLTRACFEDSSLRYANFRGANVSGTCFCGADLTGADFRGTGVTAGQLGCAAKVACNTILPNGKPAVQCPAGETCCDGECVETGSDPDNCGGCGVFCGPCQFCNFGECEDLPDGAFDCNRNPLIAGTSSLCTGQCTPGSNTGICDGGICNCGPGGVYNPSLNICQCNQDAVESCAEFDDCCQVLQTCLDDGLYCTEPACLDCEP
jgi:hypothetical protein